ncbi:MAG: hypothetical protein WCQ57_11300 [Verrucomicrobiota bacterium]
MKKKSSTPAEPVVQTPPARLHLTPSQIKRMAVEIEASRNLIADGDCGLLCVVGQIHYRDKKSGKIDALLSVRAIARDKFDGICAIMKDC